jgi:hypothetical protein
VDFNEVGRYMRVVTPAVILLSTDWQDLLQFGISACAVASRRRQHHCAAAASGAAEALQQCLSGSSLALARHFDLDVLALGASNQHCC